MGLVIHVLEAVIYVDIKIATTQVGIRTLTPTQCAHCCCLMKDRGRERQTVGAKLSWIHGPAAQSGKPSPSWGVLVAMAFFNFLQSEKHIIKE